MAEEVVLEKDSENEEEQGEQTPQQWYKDGRFILALSILLGLVFILIVILVFISSSKSEPKNVIVPVVIKAPEVYIDRESLKFDMPKIDGMIQKANSLYLRGEREEALKIYEQIALYSESLSNYNLGVAEMNQKNYSKALESFKKAIESGENQTVAAINAAVCSLYLNDLPKFHYYLDLAYVYLPNEGGSQLFNYYLSLINYYKGYYPEALQMLQQTDNEIYIDNAKYLGAKIYAKMGLDTKALENLQAQGSYESSLPMGLLYARTGQYDKAMKMLERSMKIDREKNQSIAALNLIDLKVGKYQDMTRRVKAYFGGDEKTTLDTYKIQVRLKKELSDINIAQARFAKDFMPNKKVQADVLFYYAPYQVFDTKQAASYINKANVGNYIQDQASNTSLLNTSSTLSSVNVKLAKIISKAINNKLKVANEEFKALLNSYKEHSVLHYNLALSYAQLQKYELANRHFSSAYHLDPKNYAAGAFAVLTGSLIEKDNVKLIQEINENIGADTKFDAPIYQAIISFANNDHTAMIRFLDNDTKEYPFNLIIKIITAKNNNLHNQNDNLISELKTVLKDDLLADILFFNSKNSNLNIKEYSQNAQLYFKNTKIDYEALASSAHIVRESYMNLIRICGLLNQEREKIRQALAISDGNEVGLSSVLAYMDIYAGLFEEAYGLYDVLINDYGLKDSTTYFLAAVAAIGSNNPNAAIALLELSKLEDRTNQEATLALALLYHQVENYEPALHQYSQMINNFQSEFFTFDIRH